MKAKYLLSRLIYKICASDVEKIRKSINDHEIICFDIFDTLIKRNVGDPIDVFRIIENKLVAENMGLNFTYKRLEAERKARELSASHEVFIDDIYDHYDSPTDDIDKLKATELEVEYAVCTANNDLLNLYNDCLAQGKKIILISDMYLGQAFIEKIIKKCGYQKPYKMYVSCNIGLNKSDGSLFEYAKRDNAELEGKWLHIGDSITGDFLKPRYNGIDSILIERVKPHPEYYRKKKKGVFYSFLRAFIENHENKDFSNYQKIGYEILGPLLCGFSYWLNNELNRINFDGKILFLARDSKLIMRAYETLFPENKINDIYFYTSRKAAIAPVVDLLKEADELYDLLVPKDYDRFSDLLSALNIDKTYGGQILKNYDLSGTDLIKSGKTYDKEQLFHELINASCLSTDIQRELLLKYFNKNDISNKFVLVDLGWEGRTQWSFKRLIEYKYSETDIIGFYMGLITKCPRFINDIKSHAYLGKYVNYDKNARIIMESIALFEGMFLTNDGSTLCYAENNREVIPVKAKNEQTADNITNITAMQDAAIRFVHDIKHENIGIIFDTWPPEVIFDIYKDFAVTPSSKTVKLFRTFNFNDKKTAPLGSPHSILYYLVHLGRFKSDLQNSLYRILFLKDIFKIPAPYFEALYMFYKIKHSK